MPGPPMSLCGEMKTASLVSSAASSGEPSSGDGSGPRRRGAISISTYGADAAKSQKESAPWR